MRNLCRTYGTQKIGFYFLPICRAYGTETSSPPQGQETNILINFNFLIHLFRQYGPHLYLRVNMDNKPSVKMNKFKKLYERYKPLVDLIKDIFTIIKILKGLQ